MSQNPTCFICHSTAIFLFDKDGYPHFKCPRCGLVFVHPQPAPTFLAEEVYSEKSGYQSNKVKDLSTVEHGTGRMKLLSYLASRPVANGGLRGSLLDIGCSSGELMYSAQKLGYDVSGVELNPRTAAIAKANGLKVFQGTLGEAIFAKGSFDLAHMGDLIEHVPDPRTIIAQTYELLKPGGEIIIVTPNMDCFWARSTLWLWKLFGIPWSCSTPPHHLWQFSIGNLKKLIEEEGFTVSKVWYNRCPTLKYELGSLHLFGKWKKARATGSSMANIKAFLFMLFSFGIYSIIFGVNRALECLPVKRFSMAVVAVKS